MSGEQVAAFLGWCFVINAALLLFLTLMLTFFKRTALTTHSKISGLSNEQLELVYFQFLSQYKLLVTVFNLAPYIAMKIIL